MSSSHSFWFFSKEFFEETVGERTLTIMGRTKLKPDEFLVREKCQAGELVCKGQALRLFRSLMNSTLTSGDYRSFAYANFTMNFISIFSKFKPQNTQRTHADHLVHCHPLRWAGRVGLCLAEESGIVTVAGSHICFDVAGLQPECGSHQEAAVTGLPSGCQAVQWRVTCLDRSPFSQSGSAFYAH